MLRVQFPRRSFHRNCLAAQRSLLYLHRMADRREQRDSSQDQAQRQSAPNCRDGAPRCFGEEVFTRRTELGLSQAVVASAAKVAAGYFSEIENGRRLAPPRTTAMRIAGALKLRDEQAQQLVALAEAERAASTHDAHLAPGVRKLLAEIRSAAPQLPREAVEHLRARLREVSM
ncbi:helix-turn-helix domain-containing protein [Roseateles sp. BYS87W]|uniref:Helix-turn-helix domain-containing protein n=1 Tax=Pelomonas baiyunensis TaxID=3299026 RepID=A0ABW7GSN0_9BURK